MSYKAYLTTTLVLSLGGTLFAGYLSVYRALTGSCALNEPCPFFLGYPACWYGFALFLALFLVALAARIRGDAFRRGAAYLALISFTGSIFSGSFVAGDVVLWLAEGRQYALILPSCVYGFVFYLMIFALSFAALRKREA